MQGLARQLVVLGCAASLAFGVVVVTPQNTLAKTDAEYAKEVKRCTDEYKDAQAKVEDLQAKIKENEASLAEVKASIPAQQTKAAGSIRSMYKFQRSGGSLVDLMLSATDFNEFIATIECLAMINSYNTEEINRLVDMRDQLNTLDQTLTQERSDAEAEVDRSKQALVDAENAREQARLAAAAQAAEEQKARAEALREARQHQGEVFQTISGNSVTIDVDKSVPTDNGVSGNGGSSPAQHSDSPRDEFINIWAARIDAFNSGTPLAGYGNVFAEAAYDNGVDPRWSPAIARMESSSGEVCFASHNAWGWGSAEWSDWDSAIRDHVSGLGAYYGYTISMDAARTYCPEPDPGYWYSMVSYCMNEIWGSDSL